MMLSQQGELLPVIAACHPIKPQCPGSSLAAATRYTHLSVFFFLSHIRPPLDGRFYSNVVHSLSRYMRTPLLALSISSACDCIVTYHCDWVTTVYNQNCVRVPVACRLWKGGGCMAWGGGGNGF